MRSDPGETLSGFGWVFWILTSLLLLSGVAIIYMIVAHIAGTNEAVAMRYARDMSGALSLFRTTYSEEVVGRLGPGATTEVAHDYHDRENTIPLPATLSIELAEALSGADGGAAFRLISDEPFPWRAQRELSAVEREALAHFASGGTGEFSSRIDRDGGAALVFATPVVMGETCVVCHNTHPDSPRRDWRLGDVRGIQTVTVGLAPTSLLANPGMLRIIAFLAAGFAAALALVALLVRRNQREIVETTSARNRAQESEIRIRAILENTVEAIVTTDESGKIESVNPAVERIFGYPAGSLLGENVTRLLSDNEPDQHVESTESGKPISMGRIVGIGREVRGRRVDGSLFPLELSIGEFVVGDKRMFTGIMRDITASKAAERQAREAETRLVEAIEALPDGFVLYDADDRLVVCNSRYREIYKTSADNIRPGVSFEEIIREGARRGQYAQTEQGVEAWIAARMEAHRNPGEGLEQKLDDGRWLRIIERRTGSGNTVGFRVDITALKEREEALSRSQERLARTIGAALDAIIVIDHAGCIIDFNPAAEAMFGFSREAVLGREMAELIVPERHRAAHRAGMKSFLETGKGSVLGQKIEIEGLRADSEEILIELAIQEASGAQGPIFIGYARDITAEKAGQKALLEAKERAEVASRAKAKFLAMMSHEIRTPLNGVLGILSLLQDSPLDDRQVNLVKTARESGKSLLTIINDILDFSKLEAERMVFDREAFVVDSLLQGVAGLIAPLAEQKSLTLSSRIGQDVPEACVGDQGRIRQVLLNLASNAVKFTETGSIDLSVEATRTSSEKVELLFRVTDTGVGIAEEKRGWIFSEFTTVDPAAGGQFGGTGLGLAISKAIVEAMGGRIGYESAERSGSTFWFAIPLQIADSATVLRDDDDVARAPSLTRRLRVLLAEDNATNQLVVTQMLETLGCVVDTAANGLEAVEALLNRHYDVVLMDVAMPEMDGIAATKRIRDLAPPNGRVPIIALTAYAMSEDRERFRAAGMDVVITKPIVRRELVQALESVAALPEHPAETTMTVSPFDHDTLTALLASQPKETREHLVKQFLDDLSVQRDALVHARELGDSQLIERASHILKSIAGTFGASHVAAAAERANDFAREDEHARALSEVDTLISACDDILRLTPTLVERAQQSLR